MNIVNFLAFSFLAFCYCSPAIATTDFEIPPTGQSHWLIPNEVNPIEAAPRLKSSIEGCYVVVGTERGLIGFAYSNATHYRGVDNDVDVVNYNQLSILLAKSASDGSHYRSLKVIPGSLRRDLATFKHLSRKEVEWIKTRLDWWDSIVPHLARKAFFADSSQQHFFEDQFKGRRYWQDEVAFSKLQKASRADRMSVRALNLAQIEAGSAIRLELESSGLLFSVFDINSVWIKPNWVGAHKTVRLLDELASVMSPQSIILMSRPDNAGQFYYGSITYKTYASLRKREFIEMLSSQTMPNESFDPVTLKAMTRSPLSLWLAKCEGMLKGER